MLTILYSGRVPIGPGEGFNVYGIFGLFSRELYEIPVEGSSSEALDVELNYPNFSQVGRLQPVQAVHPYFH